MFIRSILILMVAVCLVPAAAALQDDDTKAKQEKREKKATELYEQARTLVEAEKFEDALPVLKELRDRFAITSAYLDNSEQVNDWIFDCGSKIAVLKLKKQKTYRKPFRDGWYQYMYLAPQDWRGVPPYKQYSGDMDSSESNYAGQVIRVNRFTSPYLEGLYIQIFKVYDARSVKEVKTKAFADHRKRYDGLQEVKTVNFGSKSLKGLRTYCKDGDGNRMVIYSFHTKRKGFALVGAWVSRSSGWIKITSGKSSEKKKNQINDEQWAVAQKVFDNSAQTFTILPSRQKGVFLPDWKIHRTKNYVIEYNTRPEYAKTLGKHMEKIMALYRQVIPTGKGFPKCNIKLFDSKEDFLYYGQAYGAAAYWSPSQEEICAYRFSGSELKMHDETMTVSRDRDPEEETFHVIYHEGFHQYMYYLMGRERGVYVPSWLNEGMGDYFFGGTFTKKKGFQIQPNWWRLDTIHEAVSKDKHVPIKDIIRYTQSDYYSNAGLCYAEGWALCYFLLTSPVAKQNGWSGIPSAMLHQLKTSGDWKKATDRVFGKVNLDQLEAEWKKFVLSLKTDVKPESRK